MLFSNIFVFYFFEMCFLFILLNMSLNDAALNNLKLVQSGEYINEADINIDDIVNSCNDSYRITLDFLEAFSSNGEFPDETDKTPMCFVRCLYERTGIIKEGKLNKTQIVNLLWPATGDSVEVCEKEGGIEKNPCLKTYLIGKCLVVRSIVDARNKPKI